MLKREWGAESIGKLPHLLIPNLPATLVPEFAVDDLPLGRTLALAPEFANLIPALGQNTLMNIYIYKLYIIVVVVYNVASRYMFSFVNFRA